MVAIFATGGTFHIALENPAYLNQFRQASTMEVIYVIMMTWLFHWVVLCIAGMIGYAIWNTMAFLGSFNYDEKEDS